MYGPGGSYAVFAGRDASRALALGTLKEEDLANASLDGLDERQREVLEEWVRFYTKNYKQVGVLA